MTAAPWMQMASGRVWPLLSPAPEDVHWPDIAEHLAKINRYAGGTNGAPISVAQHCCAVAAILPPSLRPYGLLHDAPEAITGDIISPVKWALECLGAGEILACLESIQARAIYTAAGLEWPLPFAASEAVHRADLTLLATERRDLLAESRRPWPYPLPRPLAAPITPWPWARAAAEWLDCLERWLPEIKAKRSA